MSTRERKLKEPSKSTEKEKDKKLVLSKKPVPKTLVDQKKVKSDAKMSLSTKAIPPDRTKLRQPMKPQVAAKPTTVPKTRTTDFKAAVTNLKKPIPTVRKVAASGIKTVMDRTHNVTVLSPPRARRAESIAVAEPTTSHHERNLTRTIVPATSSHERSLTKTLAPHEITILKSNDDPIPPTSADELTSLVTNVIERAAVSFEVNFTDHQVSNKPQIRMKSGVKKSDLEVTVKKSDTSSAEESYDEDFESYESDFESGSSSQPEQINSSESNDEEPTESESEMDSQSESEKPDESETTSLTESKSTVQKNSIKDPRNPDHSNSDKLFDSGTFEVLSIPNSSAKVQLDSVDSGIECISDAVRQARQRANDILEKVTLDVMTFQLFEMKPIGYDRYMDLYGQLNCAQIPTQTNDGRIDVDCQTDAVRPVQSVGTQFPATFCGFYSDSAVDEESLNENIFDKSLKNLSKMTRKKKDSSLKAAQSDFEASGRLGKFLQAAAVTVCHVLQQNNGDKNANSKISQFDFCENQFRLDLGSGNHIPDTEIAFVYANDHVKDFFVTVLRKNDDSTNYLYLWSWLDLSTPLKLIFSWTPISCVEIHTQLTNIILAGSENGSLAFWDINEPSFYHPTRDDRKVLTASQICFPNDGATGFTEFGRMTSIKSWGTNYSSQIPSGLPAEICCLYESGWIAVWTIIQASSFNEFQTERSPWSRYQLIQRELIDMSWKSVQPVDETRFHQIRQNFEMDLFADSALQEIEQNSSKKSSLMHKVSFVALEVDLNIGVVVIASDHNFILIGTTALKSHNFKRLEFEELIHIRSIKCLYSTKILLIGLSTGEVRAESYSTRNSVANVTDQHPTKREPKLVEGSFTSKSCTIQNILKRTDNLLDLEDKSAMESTGTESSGSNDSLDSLDLQCGQVVLHGFFNLKPSVRGLLYSRNLKRIISLDGSMVRTFDVAENIQVNKQTLDITSGVILTTNTGDEVFIITTPDHVDIHRIRNLSSC